MQALDGYVSSHSSRRVKMEVHSPSSVPRLLSPITSFSKRKSTSPRRRRKSASTSPNSVRIKREYTTPLIMDPYGYDHNSWNTFAYNADSTETHEHLDMNGPQPFTIFPSSYVSSSANQQGNMISPQQWAMDGQLDPQARAHAQYAQYYPLTPGQSFPNTQGSELYSPQQQQQWSPNPQTPYMGPSPHGYLAHPHARQQQQQPQQQHHRHQPSPSLTVFPPTVPSSSPNSGLHNNNNNNDSSDNDQPHPTLAARHSTALSWLQRTSPHLTPTQIYIAQHILRSSWWEVESTEPELRSDDELVVKGLMSPGGSRFRAFLDEEKGWKCTFDHDGVPCQHGKGRMERALGTVRGFFVYKPVVCGGTCGSRCDQRFVSVEQCQKHVQKKRSGRVACPECGSSILPANMSRHRRACHVIPGDAGTANSFASGSR